jgi:hypothetical protein
MPVIPYRKRPKVLQVADVQGVYVDNCVENKPLPKDTLAHAHVQASDDFRGWICFKDRKVMRDINLCLHELAHILSNQYYHNATWRFKFLKLGGSLDSSDLMRSYKAKTRIKLSK